MDKPVCEVIFKTEAYGDCQLCGETDIKVYVLVILNERSYVICRNCAEKLSEWLNIPIKGTGESE